MHSVFTMILPHAWLLWTHRVSGEVIVLVAPGAYPDDETEAYEVNAAIDEIARGNG